MKRILKRLNNRLKYDSGWNYYYPTAKGEDWAIMD